MEFDEVVIFSSSAKEKSSLRPSRAILHEVGSENEKVGILIEK